MRLSDIKIEGHPLQNRRPSDTKIEGHPSQNRRPSDTKIEGHRGHNEGHRWPWGQNEGHLGSAEGPNGLRFDKKKNPCPLPAAKFINFLCLHFSAVIFRYVLV